MTRNCARILYLALIVAMLVSCGVSPKRAATQKAEVTPLSFSQLPDLPAINIVRHPEPVDYWFINRNPALPKAFDPDSPNPFQNDYRSADLTKLNLSRSLEGLLYSDFDSLTKWPPVWRLPFGFNPQKVMEMGKDPGLGVRRLHDLGITGRGVGIAIIDQALLVDHQEYKDQLKVYEEAEDVTGGWLTTSMHGPAVASIAVGKTVGVAPQADLFFIAMGACHGKTDIVDFDFSCLAKDILRIVEINQDLPTDRKIRVLSMSIGWVPESKGYAEITAAANEARANGIFVISTSLSMTYNLNFHGLGRDPLLDPNDFQSYEPGSWWQNRFYENGLTEDTLLVPMDARATASPTGFEDYAFYSQGGWSWCVPYLAGMYALAWQVKPGITPEEFWSVALHTGRTINIQHEGKNYSLGVILDPYELIAALQE